MVDSHGDYGDTGHDSYTQWEGRRDLMDSTEREGQFSLFSPFGVILARGALAGLAGVGKYLKSGDAVRSLWELEKYVRRSPRLRKMLPPIFEGTEHILRRRGMTDAAKSEAFAYRRMQHSKDFETLYRIAKAQSRYGGAKEAVLKEALQSMAHTPAQYGHMRHLTLHDVIYREGFTKQLEKTFGQEQLQGMRENFNLLMKSPAGRSVIADFSRDFGVGSAHQLSKQLIAGKGMFVQADEIVDAGRFLPRNVLTWFGQFRFPFTSWKPFELMFPTEMAYAQPKVAALRGEYLEALTKRTVRKSYGEAIFAGESIFPVERFEGRPFIKEPMPGRYAVGRRSSGMYRGAAAREGIAPGAFGTAENYLEQKGILSPEAAQTLRDLKAAGKKPSLREFLKYAKPESFWDKARLYATVIGERAGVGPSYAHRGSRIGSIFSRLKSMVRHKPVITSEYLTGELARAAGTTPEGAFLSKKMGQLANWVKLKPGMEVPKSVNDLSSTERLMLRLGLEPKRTVVRTTPKGNRIVEKLSVAKFAEKGASAVDTFVRDLGSEHYAWPKMGGASFGGISDWLHYQVIRPFWLMEEMTGMSMRPGRTMLGTFGKVLSKIAFPAAVTASALSYMDYRMRRRDLPGPISGTTWLYTQGRLGEQWALDKMGISEQARKVEEKYPGAVKSPMSRAARFGAFTLGGAWLGAAGGGLPALGAGMLMGAINLTDMTQSHQELKEIYSGERDIPVYKGRGWMLGRSSLFGNKVSSFRQHWYPLMTSRYKDIALYGSEADKWAHGSWLPTPENLFGMRKLLQPYALESKHYWDRPYPLTGRMGEEIPLVGPWIANSRVLPLRYIKPQYRMHPEYWSDANSLLDSVTPTQTEHAGWQLGYGYWPRFQRNSVMRQRLDQLAGEQIYRLTQWTGLTGFGLNWLKNQVTGSSNWFDKRPQVATAGQMASLQRDYYDRSIAGVAGMSEFWRRFVPRGRRYIEQANPILNTMPNWLPGTASAFERDRDGHINYSTGDSYAKLAMGEARLPGAGYCLHPNTPVLTDEGFKSACDVSFCDRLVTKTGSFLSPKRIFIRNVTEDIVNIDSYGMHTKPVKLTSNHKVLVVRTNICKYHRDSGASVRRRPCKPGRLSKFCASMKCSECLDYTPKWLPASEVEEGDFVLLPNLDCENEPTTIDVTAMVTGEEIEYIRDQQYAVKRKTKYGKYVTTRYVDFVNRIVLDDETSFLLGLVVAEGHISYSDYPSGPRPVKVTLTVSSTESYLVDYVRRVFAGLSSSAVVARPRKDSNAITIDIYNCVFARVIHHLVGRARKKRVGEVFLNNPLPFLAGLIQGDGHRHYIAGKNGYTLTVSSNYEDMVSSLTTFLFRSGIPFSLRDRPDKQCVEFNIYSSVSEKIGQYLLDYKVPVENYRASTSNASCWGAYFVLKVKSVSYEYYEGPVYDFEIPGEHSYVTNFIVHNSTLHRLHSGVPGYYSALDRLLILADVAPHSESYRHHLAIVQGQRQAGNLDQYWERKYQQAMYQVDKRFEPEFEERRYSPGSLQDMQVTVSQSLGPTGFRATDGAVYSLAGVERDILRQKWKEESRGRDSTKLALNYSLIQSKLAALEGKTISIKAASQGMSDSIPAIIPGINEEAITLGLGGEIHSPADSYARYGQSATVMAWDQLRHLRIPGPAGWPVTKFFGRRSAAEDYQMSVLEGGDFAGWDHPYRNFIRFYGRQMLNTVLPSPRIPGEVREQRHIEEYFDKLKYVKGRHMANRAMAEGMPSMADHYNKMWQGTLAGLQVEGTNFQQNIWQAIPATERRYFKAFARESDPGAREKILDMVPDYMKPIYLGIWNRNVPNAHTGYPPFGSYIPNQNSQRVVEEQVQAFFGQFQLPDPGWVGWDPSVDLERIKVRTVSNVAQDFHDYQIWEGQVREADRMMIPMAPVYGAPRPQPVIWSEMETTQQRRRKRRDLTAARRSF